MGVTINELFHSIQGEGLTTGVPTIFIRTTGCNLACAWCDTGYAREGGEEMDIDTLMERVEAMANARRHRNVCLTGGEPLIQDEVPLLVHRLLVEGYTVTLETNGSRPLSSLLQSLYTRTLAPGGEEDHRGSQSGEEFMVLRERLRISLDIKCPSSGETENMDLMNLNLLSGGDQLKFVVRDRDDLEFAFGVLSMNPVFCPAVIQPVTDPAPVPGDAGPWGTGSCPAVPGCGPDPRPSSTATGGDATPHPIGVATCGRPPPGRPTLGELADTFLEMHPGDRDVRFMLQTHRIIWGERRGV